MIRILLYALAGLIVVAPALFFVGLRLQPQPFAPYPERTPALQTIPLPDGLPAPVERFYRTAIGDEIPVINSAVISTRGRLRVAGITFPTRFRFTHDAGRGYRHYAELLLFGRPVMAINERYLDGAARMELPFGVTENEPKIDMAANLGLWGESIWLPSVFLTDPRVRWEAIDEAPAAQAARLVVPFEDGEDSFTVYFDPDTGLINRLETMRYQNATDMEKTLWINEPFGWETFHGIMMPSPAGATWADEGTPWLVVNLDDVVYNVDVSAYIRAKGP